MLRPSFITQVTRRALQTRVLETCIKCNHQQLPLLAKNASCRNLTYNTPLLSQVHPQTEQEFLVHLKNDPDTFGDASTPEVYDESDLKEEKFLQEKALPSQKKSTKQYADMIKALVQKRKIKEAIDVLEVKMLKEDQVKPENYIYNLLLGACGQVGYTKKAFSLYNNMKKRGLKATGGTYTALFNACANSPWREDGLSRAKHLRNIMIEKMYEPNETNYNAMIKAFGRCGDLPTAFSLVDEMMTKKLSIKDSINFLLQACIQDKEAGFRHALLVWRKVVLMNITPSIHTYNLIIRCIRDCGIGDIKVMNEALGAMLSSKKLQLEEGEKKLLLEGASNTENESNEEEKSVAQVESRLENSLESVDIDSCKPNLMAKNPHLGNIISLSEVTRAEDRLLLVGGYKEFLSSMVDHNCTPDVKTFTQLLDCLPGSLATEQEFLKTMKTYSVKPDIDFFNMLIKKRSMRFDYSSGRDVLEEMKKLNYRPNLITFGVLALGCRTKEEALQLLEKMQEHKYRLNTEILGAMLHQACHHTNFSYVLEVMETCLRENVQPNKIFMECLSDFKKKCKKISNDKDHKLYNSTSFQKGFRIFQMRYKTWLEQVEVDDSEDVHPWSQYRQNTETDVKHYKDKSNRFKAKHTSLFRVKTSTKRK